MSCTRVFDYFFQNPVPSHIFTHRKEKKSMRIPWPGTLSLFYETFKSWVACAVTKKRGNSKEPEDLESLSVALFIYILLLFYCILNSESTESETMKQFRHDKNSCKWEKRDFFCSGISYIRVSVGIKIEALSVK